MKHWVFGARVAAVLIVVVMACSKDPLEPAPTPVPIPSVGIDEPLLITASSQQVPALSNNNQHTFELASIPIVQSGEFNDIEIQYTSGDACDDDVELFNDETKKWVQIAWGPVMVCSPVVTNFWRTMSERDLVPREFLDEGDRLVMRTAAQPYLRVLKINSEYDPIALPPLDITASGIHVNGSTIWLASDNLSRVTTGGVKQPEIPASPDPCNGLAWDGERFWTLERPVVGDEVFYGITPLGVTECSFQGLNDFAVEDGMVFVNNLLWVVRSGGNELLGVDLDASCAGNLLNFSERLFLNTGGAVAVTHDGSDFYVAYPSTIKKVSMSGVELEDHPLTVERVIDLAWVDNALWILHTGPRGVKSGGQFVSKFDL